MRVVDFQLLRSRQRYGLGDIIVHRLLALAFLALVFIECRSMQLTRSAAELLGPDAFNLSVFARRFQE